MKGNINPDLFRFLTTHYKPGRFCLVGADDLVGSAIREAQHSLTLDAQPSKWSHAFLMGETRIDGHRYIFESDLDPDFDRPQMRNGSQESRLSKWAIQQIEHAAVLDIRIPEDRVHALLGTALKYVHEEEMAYPVIQLVGTWWQMIRSQVWKQNPFHDAMAMYCSSFVRYCYRQIDHDPVSEKIHLSNTAPEHLWQSRLISERFVWLRPKGIS